MLDELELEATLDEELEEVEELTCVELDEDVVVVAPGDDRKMAAPPTTIRMTTTTATMTTLRETPCLLTCMRGATGSGYKNR